MNQGFPDVPKTTRTRKGFTLIEVLVALTIGAAVLVSATMMVFTLGKVWAHDWSQRHYVHHKESLSTLLQRTFEEADSGFSSLGVADKVAGLRWENPPGESTLDDPLIRFYLKQPPPILISNPPLASSIIAYLYFEEGEGLYLLWYPLIEIRDGEEVEIEEVDDLYRTLLTPYVELIEYCYWDDEKEIWDVEEDPLDENDKYLMPDFLKLTFRFDDEHEDEDYISYIPLPPSEKDAPLF